MKLLGHAIARYAGRRFALFVILATIIGLPAGVLRVFCVGNACESRVSDSSTTPFCSLPQQMRSVTSQGTWEGRTGEILAVSESSRVVGSTYPDNDVPVEWPNLRSGTHTVPIVLSGVGIRRGVRLNPDAGLDDIAPTLAAAANFDRPHPEVRSGKALAEALDPASTAPRLLMVVALKGVGAADVDAARWPRLREEISDGAAIEAATVSSSAADPVASMTTIGTGGIPAEHGITGTMVRDDEGRLVTAWGPDSPINVIATLGDDLDEAFSDRSTIALVGTEPGDRALIGGRWYVGRDDDLVSMLPSDATPAAVVQQVSSLLGSSALAKDGVPDVLGVALAGPNREVDSAVGELVRIARRATRGAVTVAIAGTGSAADPDADVRAPQLKRRLERQLPGSSPMIEALGPGVVFVDQRALTRQKVSDDVVLRALLRMRDEEGAPLFADVFPTLAVSFGRFC